MPPEYRGQVEKQTLEREVSVTGEGGFENNAERIKAIKKRNRQLKRIVRPNRPRAAIAAARRNPLEGAPEPKKYDRDCWWRGNKKHCRKTLTHAWRAWDAANGGNNGKAMTRRKIGSR